MKLKTFLLITSFFFFLVAIIHLLRVFLHWDFVIGSYTIPYWMSMAAFLALMFLSTMALRFRKDLS